MKMPMSVVGSQRRFAAAQQGVCMGGKPHRRRVRVNPHARGNGRNSFGALDRNIAFEAGLFSRAHGCLVNVIVAPRLGRYHRLLEGLVVRDLGGDTRLNYDVSGVRCSITAEL
jgi:hypothetical protein